MPSESESVGTAFMPSETVWAPFMPSLRVEYGRYMALYYDLPVFQDTYQLTLKIFKLTQHFSREYKYTLGQDMKHDCICLVRSIYRANKAKAKVEYLEQFLDEFEVLKLEVRLCFDLKLITVKQQSELAYQMEIIGRQITGWRNKQVSG